MDVLLHILYPENEIFNLVLPILLFLGQFLVLFLMKLSHLSLKQVHLALQVLRSLLLVITLSFKELNLFLLHADFFILFVNESHKVLLVRFQVAQGREFLLFSTLKHQKHLVFGGLKLRLQVLIFSLKFLHSLSNLFRRVSNNFVHINSRLYLLRF